MNVQERLRNLENYANKKEEDKRREMEETLRKEEEMIEQIKALKPRIKDLILVGNSCLSNGIYIGELPLYKENKDRYFLADEIRHHLGFDTNGRNPIYYLGIFGDGRDYSLRTNGNTVNVDGNKLYVLIRFLQEFDDFEKKFYAYVDKFH